VITLIVPANPDGMDMVSNWYMREEDTLKRTFISTPELCQKYAGHDNNRDFYMAALKETEAMNRVLYKEWFPQIVYNHHQYGSGVIDTPPLRNYFNYYLDPLAVVGVDVIGDAMNARFLEENMSGVNRGDLPSAWWDGCMSNTALFHNMVGVLTETYGHPTPSMTPFNGRRYGAQIDQNDVPNNYRMSPLLPLSLGEKWHFAQSMQYIMIANRAILDLASNNREKYLYNIYRMARNSI
jgi:hypothetical protein